MLVNDVVATSVASLVICNKKILLGRRFENNQFIGWQCPGGYLMQGLSIEQAAKQSCLQKAGIEVNALKPGPYSNNIFPNNKHTSTLYVIANAYAIKDKRVYEDDNDQWSWFSLDELPETLFLPLKNLLSQYSLKRLSE